MDLSEVESEDALVYSDRISSSKDTIKPHSHMYRNPDFIRMLSSVTVCVGTNVDPYLILLSLGEAHVRLEQEHL